MDAAMRDGRAAIGPEAGRILDASPRGVSVVIGPTGEPVSEILADQEGLLYAGIDLAACASPSSSTTWSARTIGSTCSA
jgi:aliphatic nitrilase